MGGVQGERVGIFERERFLASISGRRMLAALPGSRPITRTSIGGDVSDEGRRTFSSERKTEKFWDSVAR